MLYNDEIKLYNHLIKSKGVVMKTTDIIHDEHNYPVELNVFHDLTKIQQRN